MKMSIKQLIKKYLPNAVGYWQLYQHKRVIANTIKEVQSLNKSDYPGYLKRFYKKRTGHQLDLENPQRFSEKVQWRKLYDRDPIYSLLSDKLKVRKWVKDKIGEQYIIPLIGCWNGFKEINFNELPQKFVLKTNNGCHANIIVKNKKKFLREKWIAEKKMNYWMTPFDFWVGLELHYFDIEPKIIAEEYIEPVAGLSDLVDYKFHCFNGNPFMCEVIEGRTEHETVDYFDMKWNHFPVSNPPFPVREKTKEKPQNYDLMVQLAKILSQGFQYVRVDLYDNGKVYFGEMTFTPASGIDKYDPDDWDYTLGALWDIHSSQVNQSVVFEKL